MRLSLALLCAAAAASAQEAGELRAVVAARRAAGSEQVDIARAVVTSLLKAGLDQPLRVSEWPLAPGVRGRLELRRFDVYSPGAQLIQDDDGRKISVPRSRLLFFDGRSKSDPSVRVLLWLDPGSRRLGGFADSRAGRHHLLSGGRNRRSYRVTREAEVPGSEVTRNWSCGVEPDAQELETIRAASAASIAIAAPAITTLHYADIAVDTDNELMLGKFANDTTAASNYIAQLLASMSVMYERDLKVRLRQGFTVLRTSPDPYNELPVGGGATGAQLNEFTNHWKANYGGQARTVAMMLSGKATVGGPASGIAWVDGLCSKDLGYSFTQVFSAPGSAAAASSKLVGHELGHNFGSLHSHCYDLDECWDCEPCNSDGTLSCPAPQTMNGVANVRGTVMSYCHFGASSSTTVPPKPCSLGGCTSSEVFHPTTVANVLNPEVQDAASAPNQCISPVVVPAKFFTVAPCRLIDTRIAGGAALGAGVESQFTIPAGTCSIPALAVSLSVNVTVPAAGGGGHLSLYPANIAKPSTTTLNFSAGATRANNAVVALSLDLGLKIFNGAAVPVHVVVDVNGYFAVSP